MWEAPITRHGRYEFFFELSENLRIGQNMERSLLKEMGSCYLACSNHSLGLFGKALHCYLFTGKVTVEQLLEYGWLRGLLIALILALDHGRCLSYHVLNTSQFTN